MRNHVFRAIVLLVALLGLAVSGCSIPTAMPKEMAVIAEKMGKMMDNQGVMDYFKANMRGHVSNPGMKAEIGVVFFSKVGFDGVDADLTLAQAGTGTQLAEGTREALLSELAVLSGRTDPEANALRDQILTALGWNRVTSEHNPVPEP